MTPRNSRRLRRIAVTLLVLAAIVALAAWIVPNALLRSDFIRSGVNRDPESSWLEYESASSRWPGTLRVKKLRFRDRDAGAEWAFELEEAQVTYSLGALLRRKFHATRVSGRGVVFHARNRLTPAQATPSRVRRLPPIPGFSDPPLLGPPRPKPPTTGKAWTIQIDRLAIEEVRELWIDSYRFVGDGRLTGGFHLRPKQRAEVFPAKLVTRNGTLRSGGDVIAGDVRATIACRIEPWDPRAFPGSRMLRFVSGDADATAQLDDAEIVNRLLGEPAGTRLEKGKGRMDVRGSVEKGTAKWSTAYSSRDLDLRVLDVAMRGRFDARVELSGVDIRTLGDGRLDGGHVRLTNATVLERDGKAHPWWGRVDFERGVFRPKTAALFTTTASVRARDARPLLQIVNVDLPDWLERLLRLDDELEARASIRIGKSLVEIRRLTAQTGRLRIWGDYAATGSGKRGTFLFDAGPLSVGVRVSGGDADIRLLGPRKWFRERTDWDPWGQR